MRKTFILFTFLFASTLVKGQSFKDFKWMTGTWERQNTKAGSTAFETWGSYDNDGLRGQGVSMRGVDTVFVEKLSLISKDDSFYYIAEVSHNSAPTYFKVTSSSKNGFVCENPTHDFPKKIDYKLKGDLLTVVISGDGKEIPFQFIKVN